jgi:uncharacterized tellurite resistance protein B-like protein
MVIHKSFADFVLFLYVHMAHADGELHDTEKNVVLEKMSKLFPGESEHAKRFDQAVVEYHKYDHKKVMDIIRSSFSEYSDIKFSQKYKVYSDMYDIANADGKVVESETKALEDLKEIIDIASEVKNQK